MVFLATSWYSGFYGVGGDKNDKDYPDFKVKVSHWVSYPPLWAAKCSGAESTIKIPCQGA
jgi:hypothetical protein